LTLQSFKINLQLPGQAEWEIPEEINKMSCNCKEHGDNIGKRKDYQYAVKVVVGNIPENTQGAPLPWGSYYTKVNIHNYSRCDCVTFKWKVAIGNPGLRVGPISGFSERKLCADEALEITNRDIIKQLKQGDALPSHFEGWVVMESPEELDVVAVYATAKSDKDGVNTFHTERVQPRCMVPCDDLFGDLATGAAMWEVQHPGQSTYSWAILTPRNDAWIAPPVSAVWVSPSGDENKDDSSGEFIYRLRFKLCSGFSDPVINFALAADDKAQVKLNGQNVSGSGTPNYVSMTNYSISNGFKIGDNELTVIVNNAGGPTGLLINGTILVKGGQCPGEGFGRWPCPEICYKAHVKKLWPWVTGQDGWLGEVCNGQTAGTVGQRRRLEAFTAHLTGTVAPGTRIVYAGNVEHDGWTHHWLDSDWTKEGDVCGTTGSGKRMEAIEVRFIVAPPCCSVTYRVHMRHKPLSDLFNGNQGDGYWSDWMRDGAEAGTTGQNRRIEAIEMKVECITR
jgi:hypothetical protein